MATLANMFTAVQCVRPRWYCVATSRSISRVAPSDGAAEACCFSRVVLECSNLALLAWCTAAKACFTGWTNHFGCGTRLVVSFLHWDTFRSVGFRLVGIFAAIDTGYGTRRVGIGTGCAFNASNGSFVGGVGSSSTIVTINFSCNISSKSSFCTCNAFRTTFLVHKSTRCAW